MSRTASATPRAERRRQELEQRREQKRRTRATKPSGVLRSPMVLITGAAVLIGVLIVGFMLVTRPAGPALADVIAPDSEIPFGVAAEGRTLGSADAPVTVEIWSDFQCPACMNFATQIEPQTISTYVVPGKVRFVYRDAAFQGMKSTSSYDESVEAAAGARCAADQGRFWEMHNWLFANWNGENEGAFAADRLRAIASAANLDMTSYDSCMAIGDKQAAARSETNDGRTAGVDHTPTLVVNGQPVVGSPRDFVAFALILEQAIAAQ